MPIKLYYAPASPSCRATLLTVKALGIDVELVPVNLALQEHLTSDFLQINPFHTVPTIQDGSFNIWDSHAINAYLVDKYGRDDKLYPKDLARRAIVNQRLHFDSSVLGARLAAITTSLFKEGSKVITKDKHDAFLQGLTILETVLESSKYVAGDALTIADFNLAATVSSANAVFPLATNRFPEMFKWLERLESLPFYKGANQEGLDQFAALIKSKNVVRQLSSK